MAFQRVVRQVVEALGGADGKVRVTRQVVEVLHAPASSSTAYDVEAEDSLDLTEQRSLNVAKAVAAEDTLTWTEIIGLVVEAGITIYEVEADETLDLSEETGRLLVKQVAAEDTLSFTETVGLVVKGVGTKYTVAAEDTLGLTEQVARNLVRAVSAADALNLREFQALGRPRILAATDLLQEEHSTYNEETGRIETYCVGLDESATAAKVPLAPTPFEDRIIFSEAAVCVVVHANAIAVEAEDALELTDAAYIVRTAESREQLTFTDEATVEVVKPTTDTLTLTETATVNVIRNLVAEDTLTLCEASAFVGGRGTDALHTYCPFVGGGVGDPTPPPASCPQPNATGECRLCYPVSHPTVFVTLRSPEFGNKDRLQFNRISRETRGGTLIVYADPMWPKLETLVLTFRGLSGSQVQDYLDFVRDHLGLEVGFVDWEGFYWKGVIMNPEEPTVQDGKEIYTVSFEFECEPATWEP